jgi:hypothetical protein
MDPEDREVLGESLERMKRKETLEHAVGRVARKRGLDFSAYVRIMSEVRERAHSSGTDQEKAARDILRDGHEDS